MKRRMLLFGGAAALAMPRLARARDAGTLVFVPYTDLALLDPIATPNYAVRNHAMMVFDTLYGIDDRFQAQPQMVEGAQLESDGRICTLTLRDGLRFHDGEPVLGRDVVASLRRWGARDNIGRTLMTTTDELDAPSDRSIRFRLKAPFPLLHFALGKANPHVAVIMPERLAKTYPFKPVGEVIGSGPFRFVAGEHVQGVRAVYQRFDGYVPRTGGTPSFLAGPKVAHFERVEWHIISDPATAAAALQTAEVDWWEVPTPDYWPVLKARPDLTMDILDPSGGYSFCRLNHLHPPFDSPAVRRAALAAISQADVQSAAFGTDPAMWRTHVGFFAPNSPMANRTGMEAIEDPPDLDRARHLLRQSGYDGTKVVMLTTSIVPWLSAAAEVVMQAWQKIGFKVELVTGDVASLLQHLGNKGPTSAGGWNAECDSMAGMAAFDPISNNALRGDGSVYGWPKIPRLEELRSTWLAAPDQAAQKEICRQIQALCFDQVPYIPTGVAFRPTAYRKTITGVLHGIPLFYNVRPA